MQLNEGEVICDQCNGKGYEKYTEPKGNNFYIKKRTCIKCHGDGKLDWLENITGKENTAIPILKKRYMRWGFHADEEPTKKSSYEIKEEIDPYYRKKLERRIAYAIQNP